MPRPRRTRRPAASAVANAARSEKLAKRPAVEKAPRMVPEALPMTKPACAANANENPSGTAAPQEAGERSEKAALAEKSATEVKGARRKKRRARRARRTQ